ncbi:DNA repair protein Swi5/Sae3 [Cryptococcus wingfieldii CBS 7118]|uniref:DNA repair protein Swi5/Sae3 n=1 Tax=Cryptococcus wingfieldii CBS 7118 TaxID=1295528 RepID=A0A1E3JKB9_9TREE|nr:DNA repair protein Swi5/Sae3 [Cryptococcus wingfieldii CBS 7118]ODO00567.1 DNA repair protein Swi5/Sae3 [Cryptococcus wingfieldii CBS 7118]
MPLPLSSPSPAFNPNPHPKPLKSSPFKTPSSTRAGGISSAGGNKAGVTPKSMRGNSIFVEEKVGELRKEVEELRKVLGDKDPNKILQQHIHLLHTYNEIKDGAQSLIGRYALMTNRTIRDVHEELDLPLTDE